jgi:cyanophycin synthetase
MAAVAPAIGPRNGLDYWQLVRRQAEDRVARVYEWIWRDAADEVGIALKSSGDGTFTFHQNGRSAAVWNGLTPLSERDATATALNKPEVGRRIAAAGIPVPPHLAFSTRDFRGAFRFLAQHGGPCVVKPAAMSGGSGVTCGVRTRQELVQALLAAAAFDRRLMIERQVVGDVFRFLFLDGVLIDVLLRHPSRVTGDGSSTVMELIGAENLRRVEAGGFAGFQLIRPDLDCVLTLRAAGLRARSVPAAGVQIAVKTSTGNSGASDTETIELPPAPALVEEAAAAVRAVGTRLAGVDLVTSDLGTDLRTSGGAILEVNVPPGLHYHYLVAAPARARRIAVPILRCVVESNTTSD